MKTLKDLNKNLISKVSGSNYNYQINDKKFSINEFNGNKGWCLNEFKKGAESSNFANEWFLVNSYGYNGLTLKQCKEMILININNNY
jgi:hypothetical protein